MLGIGIDESTEDVLRGSLAADVLGHSHTRVTDTVYERLQGTCIAGGHIVEHFYQYAYSTHRQCGDNEDEQYLT